MTRANQMTVAANAPRLAKVLTPISEVYPVHDFGFVEVDGVYGTETDILRRARITTRKMSLEPRPDKKLLGYLLEHGHTSPFGFVQVTLLVRAPIFVARQWFRHRTGQHLEVGSNLVVETDDETTCRFHEMQEFSGRYSPYEPYFYVPAIDDIQGQSATAHQSRDGIRLDDAERIRQDLENETNSVIAFRNGLLERGVAREVARMTTPINQYVEFYWQQSLPNLLHWLELRRAPDAQLEIQKYAEVIEGIVNRYFPLVYAIWDDLVSGARLKASDLEEILPHLAGAALPHALCKKLRIV